MAATYKVGGMTCEGCARAVTNALKQALPGATVGVELAGGKVALAGVEPADAAVKAAIESAGFAFGGRLA